MVAKRIAAAAAALIMSVTALSSCGNSIKNNEKSSSSSISETESTGSADSEAGTTSEDEEAVPVYNDTNFENVNVPYVEYKKTYQAESGTLIGDTASVKKDRAFFKGDGYVSGATLDNWTLSFDLPESQFYNITVQTASDSAVNCRLYINGREVWIFRTANDGNFSEKNLENIWLEKGINEISIQSTDNLVDIDYVTIEANSDISVLNPNLDQAKLSNPKANYRAKALYQIICSNYGKQVLTAQHDTAGGTSESALVGQLTQKSPAIRAADIGGYTKQNTKDASKAIKYFEDGGLVAYDWYWIDPAADKNSVSYEVKNTNFDMKKAVPKPIEVPEQIVDEDGDGIPDEGTEPIPATTREAFTIEEMASWEDYQIEEYHNSGDISDECYYILKDIDKISAKLLKLQESGVPVIWRPLPVASNGLYWWGTDKDTYKWLWKLLYTRMTTYHGLNNLVWVWSAQNADWYVGDEYCDILSVDIYTDGNRNAQINTLLFLNNLCKTKPLAISECGNLPAIESILQEKAFWAYTALYTEPYFSAETGVLNSNKEEADKLAERFSEFYNNNYTITRDELPNLVDIAKSIRSEEKAAKKAAKKAKQKEQSDDDNGENTENVLEE